MSAPGLPRRCYQRGCSGWTTSWARRTIASVEILDSWMSDPMSMLFVGDRFTGAAQRALREAQAEARRLGHQHVGTEHLLLALVADPAWKTGSELAKAGATREAVLAAVEPTRLRVTPGAAVPRPNAELKSVTTRSLREMLGAGASVISTDLLLLAMLSEGYNLGARILDDLGVSPGDLRQRLGHVSRGRDGYAEMADDVTALRKENTALRAAVSEMRPVFDRSVREAESGGASDREWARHARGMIAAGEFGEPRHLLT
jgi:hypothetical protein